jgi:hypothetical protein
MKSQSLTRKCCPRAHFFRGSEARIIMSGEGVALIRSWHEQNAQMKSQRSFGVITGASRPTRAHAAQSSTAQTQFLRPIRGKYSRAGHRQRQASANLATFMTNIRRFIKTYAILCQKIYTRFSENTFNQGNRVLGSRVATDLDIRDRVSMKTGRLSQVPNRPIQRSTCHPNLCSCHRHETVLLSHVTTSQPESPCRRINGGIQ